MTRQIGLYLHIPFCARKCAYCDFASWAGREDLMTPYVEAVLSEMARRGRTDAGVATLYIGGGTPSLLPPPLMDRLLTGIQRHFDVLPDAEWTCECNPGTVTGDFLAVLREHGVNRLSMGAQAGQERLLKLLGRIHSWEQVAASADLARQYGFDNLNLDLMLGLPTQTVRDVEASLDAALSLSPTHLSCYGLILEEGTPLFRQVREGVYTLPDEDTEREMYETCRQSLARHGFRQYEISNFALPGFACRHNLDCWRRKEYVGLGCAACGFLGSVRYQNPTSLADYLGDKPPEETILSPEDARFESVMLGLRTMEGVSEADFLRMHGVTLRDAFGEKLQKPLDQGLIQWQDGFLRLTRRGMDVQNAVLVALL